METKKDFLFERCSGRALMFFTCALIIAFGLTSYASAALAGFEMASLDESQDYQLSYDQPVVVDIARDGINRIEVQGDRIEQVIGDNRFFSVMHDERSGMIFLTVRRASVDQGSKKQVIELSLQLASGRHIDLQCCIKKGSRRLVRILDLAQSKARANEQFAEVESMVQHMLLGREGKYFVNNKAIKLKGHHFAANLQQIKTYRYGDLVGYHIQAQNKGKKPLTITNRDFSRNFANVLAVYPKKQILAKKARGDFIIVTEYKRR